MTRRLLAVALLSLSAALSGCTAFAQRGHEPMRIGTLDDLSAESLGFRPGVTTLAEARAAAVARGLTGVVASDFAPERGPTLGVLGADYQSRVHVFVAGVYRESLPLPRAGWPPYGMAVRVGSDRTSPVLAVVMRDPLGRPTQAPQLVTYRWSRDRFEPSSVTSLSEITSRHGGMTHPVLVGNGFADSGVMLVARDRQGVLWDRTYMVRIDRGELALAPISTASAMKCSCVQAYAFRDEAPR